MKKLISLLLAVLMLMAMTVPAMAEGETIAVVLKTLSSEYWNYVKAGCDAAAADLGINVTVIGPGAESDITGQVSMIVILLVVIAAGIGVVVFTRKKTEK